MSGKPLQGPIRVCQASEGCPLDALGIGSLFCRKHYARFRRHGDTVTVKTTPYGEDNWRWAGSQISYRTAHSRIALRRGKASGYTCSCGDQAGEWAYAHDCPNELQSIRGPYSADPGRYKPMCIKCHRTFDNYHAGRVPA